MKRLPIPHKEIYVVPCKKEAYKTKTSSLGFLCIKYSNDPIRTWSVEQDLRGSDWKIHGFADANTIDFDAAQVVPKEHGMLNNVYALRHYISAADVWFVNPLGEIPKREFYFGSNNKNQQEEIKWQAAQNNVVEEVVIIEKKG